MKLAVSLIELVEKWWLVGFPQPTCFCGANMVRRDRGIDFLCHMLSTSSTVILHSEHRSTVLHAIEIS
jgi:hypothetical protein